MFQQTELNAASVNHKLLNGICYLLFFCVCVCVCLPTEINFTLVLKTYSKTFSKPCFKLFLSLTYADEGI